MLKYKLNYQDYAIFNSYILSKNIKNIPRTHYKVEIFNAIIFIAIIMYIYFETNSYVVALAVFISLLISYPIFGFLFRTFLIGKPSFSKKTAQRKVDAINMKELYPEEDGYDAVLYLEPGGVTSESMGVKATYSYDSIREIEDVEDYTFIRIGNIMGLILPHKKIETEEVTIFLDALRQKLP